LILKNPMRCAGGFGIGARDAGETGLGLCALCGVHHRQACDEAGTVGRHAIDAVATWRGTRRPGFPPFKAVLLELVSGKGDGRFR